jgi:putative transposase
MGSTYTKLYYHIVWSTKVRCPFIAPEWEPRLHAWLGGAIRHVGGVADTINGMPDHVHVLASLRPVHALAKVVGDIKGGCSEWVHQELKVPMFGWQDGYFAVTVSPTQLAPVRRYIQNQKAHHAKLSWEEELKDMLAKAGIEYDPKYLL